MSKQNKPADKPKEPSVIADRIVIMAPEASVKAGLQFFRDKVSAEDQAVREGYKPLSVLDAKELLLALHAACRVATGAEHTNALIQGQKLLDRHGIK
jgi:hypothetical protein